MLRCRHFLHGKDDALGIPDIAWFDTPERLSYRLLEQARRLLVLDWSSYADIGITALMPSGRLCRVRGEDRVFRLPTQNVPTRLLIDTAQPGMDERDISGEEISVVARSAVLTKSVLRPPGS